MTDSSSSVLHRRAIERQRRLQIRFAAEQDQADAIADAPLDEVRRDGLQRREPIDPFAVQLEVLLFHAAREVDGQQQVAARHRQRDGLADELRPRGRERPRAPTRAHKRGEAPAPRGVGRAHAREIGELGGDGHLERGVAIERLGRQRSGARATAAATRASIHHQASVHMAYARLGRVASRGCAREPARAERRELERGWRARCCSAARTAPPATACPTPALNSVRAPAAVEIREPALADQPGDVGAAPRRRARAATDVIAKRRRIVDTLCRHATGSAPCSSAARTRVSARSAARLWRAAIIMNGVAARGRRARAPRAATSRARAATSRSAPADGCRAAAAGCTSIVGFIVIETSGSARCAARHRSGNRPCGSRACGTTPRARRGAPRTARGSAGASPRSRSRC